MADRSNEADVRAQIEDAQRVADALAAGIDREQAEAAVLALLCGGAHQAELLTHFKEVEERLLRDIDVMRDSKEPHRFDGRWLSIAQTQLEQGFMALGRAVFQPQRIALPGDEKPE